MARFKFRLTTLLKLREAERDERRGQLAQAYRADEVLSDMLEQTRSELNSQKERRRKNAEPGVIDIDRLIEAQRYEIILKVKHGQICEQRERLAAEIERRRVALLAANREVRVLDKLRERQLEQHNQAENRADIKRLDEIALLQSVAAEETL
jgi:flagellar protein FliJ